MTNEQLAEIERRADPMRLENTIDDIAALLAEVRRLQAFGLNVVEMYREAQMKIINNGGGNTLVTKNFLAQEVAVMKNEIAAQQEATP